jgi:hypothetical protein
MKSEENMEKSSILRRIILRLPRVTTMRIAAGELEATKVAESVPSLTRILEKLTEQMQ